MPTPKPHGSGGTALVSPPRFKPKRDRSVKSTVVECPTCKAAVGVACRTSTGGYATHRARRVMAIRLENGRAAEEGWEPSE